MIHIPGLEALESADLMILFTRWRSLPDGQMKHIVEYVESGKPVIGLYEAGNVGIIIDPLSDSPMLIAATRPTPYGYPVDLQSTPDGRYLYVSYQGVRVMVRPPVISGNTVSIRARPRWAPCSCSTSRR